MKHLTFMLLFAVSFSTYAQSPFFNKQRQTNSSGTSNDFAKQGGLLRDSSDIYFWNASQWTLQERKIYTYSGINVTEILTVSTSTLQPLEKVNYTYDANGKVTSRLSKMYELSLQTYVNSSRTEERYDGQGNTVSYRDYSWNTGTGEWDLNWGDSTYFVYDGQNRVSQMTMFELLPGGGFEADERATVLAYNSSNQPATAVFESWNDPNWEIDTKYEDLEWANGFDWSDAEPTAFTEYIYVGGNYELARKHFSVVMAGKVIQSYYLEWNGMSYDSTNKDEFFYDVKGHRERQIWSEYDIILGWVASSGDLDSNIYGTSDEVLENYNAFFSGTGWTYYLKTVNYYSGQTSVNKLAESKLSVYPNPTFETVTISVENIESADLQVFDLGGQLLVSEKNISPMNHTIDLSALNPGLYIIKVSSPGQSISGRLVKN